MNTNQISGDPWEVFDYESDMFEKLHLLKGHCRPQLDSLGPHINSAIVESMLLHIRQLCEILLSLSSHRDGDDIKLVDLVGTFVPIRLSDLRNSYGVGASSDVRWIINKKMAHPTKGRSTTFNYTDLINCIAPILFDVIAEVRKCRLQSGR